MLTSVAHAYADAAAGSIRRSLSWCVAVALNACCGLQFERFQCAQVGMAEHHLHHGGRHAVRRDGSSRGPQAGWRLRLDARNIDDVLEDVDDRQSVLSVASDCTHRSDAVQQQGVRQPEVQGSEEHAADVAARWRAIARASVASISTTTARERRDPRLDVLATVVRVISTRNTATDAESRRQEGGAQRFHHRRTGRSEP